MSAYRRVHDYACCHLQADCLESGITFGPSLDTSMGIFTFICTLPYIPLLYIRDYDLRTTETSSFHACARLVLAAAASACVVRQSGTNFHRICEAETLENSLSVALSAGYLSVDMAGGASDRHYLKARRTNGLTSLLTYLVTEDSDAMLLSFE